MRKEIEVILAASSAFGCNNDLRHARIFDDNFRALIETSGVCIISNVRRASRLIVGNLYAVLFPNLLFIGKGSTLRLISKAESVRVSNVFAATFAAFTCNVFDNPSILELSRTIELRKNTVNFDGIANNGFVFKLVVTNRTVFVEKTVNKNGVSVSVFDVYVTVCRTAAAVEAGDLTAYVVFLRRVFGKVFTDSQSFGNRKGRTVGRKSSHDGNFNFRRFRFVAAGNGCNKRNFRSFRNGSKRHRVVVDGNKFAIARPRNQSFGVRGAAFGKLNFRVALIGALQAERLNGICNLFSVGDLRSVNKTDKFADVVAFLAEVLGRNRTANRLQRAVVTKVEFNVGVAVSIFFEHGNNRVVGIAPIEFGNGALSVEYDIVMAAVFAYTHTYVVLNVFNRFTRSFVNGVLEEIKIEVGFATRNVFNVNVGCFFRLIRRLEVVTVHSACKVQVGLQRGLINVEFISRIFSRLALDSSSYVLADSFNGKSKVLRVSRSVGRGNRSRKYVIDGLGRGFINVYFYNVALILKDNAFRNVNAPRKGVIDAQNVGDHFHNFEVYVVVGVDFLVVHTLQDGLYCLEVDSRGFG